MDGEGSVTVSACQIAPFVATTSARSWSTSTSARRTGTTESGSRLAFNTSARGMARGYQQVPER